MSLSQFGVVHVDRPAKVVDELPVSAAGADAVFVEWPEEMPGPRRVARVAGRHPLGLLGAFLLSLLYAPLTLAATRRYEPAERVAIGATPEGVDPLAAFGLWVLAVPVG